MDLVLDEDQELIAKTALDFVREHSPVSRFRALRDEGEPLGYSRALFSEMAALGWTGIPFDESVGGAGMGLAELVLVVEALGRKLAPEPFLGSIAMAGSALALAEDGAARDRWLPGVADGSKRLALAHQEPRLRYDLFAVGTRAEPRGDAFVVQGEKSQVIDGFGADAILIPARVAGEAGERAGITLFVVASDAAGLEIERQARVDGRNAAIVRLEGVICTTDDIVGRPGEGGSLLEQAIERATVVLCAEMLGGMSEAFELTLEYLKTREQFGVPIGSFQGLAHRAARVFMEVELARSTVMAAARAVDAGQPDAARLVSLAKARCSDAYLLAANEGVQMFGGVGMTDEYDIGFYLKRARASELTFGDAAYHRARWATLGRY
ncbi:MAG: acyl-CoA dehydrogenase family protein [Deltaproteobacteria bacterium]|jgi:alkylation response protein AidB-like acyl-CoA dehydrogenase|nr:acyl-CoA dehydrogenase family protein [Deltaproteobacteria bacterium]